MTGKVTRLQAVAKTEESNEPNALTVQRVEELLVLAKEGELQGFVIVGETNEGHLFEGGAEIYDVPLAVLGLELAKRRLLDAMDTVEA